MEYKEEIIELLKEYIDIKKNDKKKYEELFTKKALYEELMNVINVNYEDVILASNLKANETLDWNTGVNGETWGE